MQRRRDSRPIDGIVLLDKPARLGSNSVLQRVKRLYRAERAGHTGTLDPMATGMLPICLGEATKFGGLLLESDKAYRATVKLGERTATGDAEGEVIERRPVDVVLGQLHAALAQFSGEIEQTPPMYSALKHKGRPLYQLAREGRTVERQPRRVRIHRLDLLEWNPPALVLHVLCSKGTYIRSLAEDIGANLGCGAHLEALRRTAIGPFQLGDSRTLDWLEACSEAERDRLLLPVDAVLASWLRTTLEPQASSRFRNGQTVALPAGNGQGAPKTAVYDESGRFLGIGEADEHGLLRPKRLIRNP